MARPAVHWRIRFWKHVEKSEGCWMWKSATDKDGYGLFQLLHPRKLVRAHRLSYYMERETDPVSSVLSMSIEDFVMHTCDTPGCVNPKHLLLGDVLANNRDKIAKGRFRPWNKADDS